MTDQLFANTWCQPVLSNKSPGQAMEPLISTGRAAKVEKRRLFPLQLETQLDISTNQLCLLLPVRTQKELSLA